MADLAANQSTTVLAFALNYKLPMSCIMTSGPMSRMGRCAIGDSDMRLREASWQAPLAAAAPPLPVFQDTPAADVWDSGFGGGHDDLLVYDRHGRLFAYLPSAMSQEHVAIPQDLLRTDGVANVRTTLLLAASQPAQRCLQTPPPASPSWAVTWLPWLLVVLLSLALALTLWWVRKLPCERWRRLHEPRVTQLDGPFVMASDGKPADVHHGAHA